MATPLLFAVIAALIASQDPVIAVAQDAKPEAPVEETFLTADGINLRGLFHKSTKDPASAPVVILLYPPGRDKDKERDMTQGDWVGLANRLAGAGYHVFRFDWRGHGKKGSDIKDTQLFWNNSYTGLWNNRLITGAPPKKPIKSDLYLKDIKDPFKYSPTLLLDLAAVRAHLDSKNDAGELNTSSIYLIGAESAATIGMAWMATEWNRPGFAPTPNQLIFPAARYEFVPQRLNGGIPTAAGEDISGAVWLSGNHPASVSEAAIKNWIARQAPKLRDNNHMLFMYGEKDAKGKRESEFFFNEVLVGKGNAKLGLNPLNEKFLHVVKGAEQLSGAALLGNNAALKTEDTIVEFLRDIQKEKAKITRKQRGFTAPWFINLNYFGFTL
jgi:hypothetical protein